MAKELLVLANEEKEIGWLLFYMRPKAADGMLPSCEF